MHIGNYYTCKKSFRLASVMTSNPPDDAIAQRPISGYPSKEEIQRIVVLASKLTKGRLNSYYGKIPIQDGIERMLSPFMALVNQPQRLCLQNIRVLHLIAQGGFARVFKIGDKTVAIKHARNNFLPPNHFQNELDCMRKLQNKRVVTILGYFYEGSSFYVLEYCLGALHQYAASEIGHRNIARFIYQTLEGVAWIHDKGYIHRDLKPENFLVTTKNNAKITDFGLMFKLPEGKDRMKASERTGTYDMLDPLALIDRVFGRFTDIFSFGAAWFEISSGKPFLRPRVVGMYKQGNSLAQHKHHADAFRLGRIKEECKNGVWRTRRDKRGRFLRESITDRIKKCPCSEIIKMLVHPDPNLRPSAKDVLTCAPLVTYLKENGLCSETLDDDMTTPLPDMNQSMQQTEHNNLWPSSFNVSSIVQNSYQWWMDVSLSPLYFDKLDLEAEQSNDDKVE